MISMNMLFERIRQKCEEQGWQPDEASKRARAGVTLRYPPATQEHLFAAEAALGFPLPTMLRALYSQVANGGFGPGFGIVGVPGGFADGSIGGNIVEAYHAQLAQTSLVDYTQYKRETDAQTTFVLPIDSWDDRLLPLCDWGCLTTSYLDRHTGQVFRGAPISGTTYVLRLQAASLEEWLECWLNGKL